MELLASERIVILISKLNLSQSRFAEKINVNQATLSKMIKSKTNPGYSTLYGILNAFPLVNIEWIIIGKGDVFKNDDGSNDAVSDESVKYQMKKIKKKLKALEKVINEK